MKIYIRSSKDPDNNPSDRAEAIIQSLGSSITNLHNIHSKYIKLYKEHGDDDDMMTTLADEAGDILNCIDAIVDQYKK